MATQAIRVTGLRELERAFSRADKAVRDDLRDALMEAAAPVRSDAQALAAVRIRNITAGSSWSRMRIGAARSVVYIAPVERGTTSRGLQQRKRRNLADLLMNRAMEPALAMNVRKVEERLDHMLDEVADVWDRR